MGKLECIIKRIALTFNDFTVSLKKLISLLILTTLDLTLLGSNRRSLIRTLGCLPSKAHKILLSAKKLSLTGA